MNTQLTEIAYILDRSGSMSPMQEPAVTAFNHFIKAQLDVPGDARVTLVQFDDAYEVPIAALPVQDVPELTAATFVPRGSTALLDAIGRTIKETDARIQAMPEPQRPAKVIVAIFTDGEENASREYTLKHVGDLIRLFRDEKGWDFLFLAANQDAIATAAAMNLHAGSTANVAYGPKSIRATGSAFARKARSLRMKQSGQMDADALADEAKTMEQILREEEDKAD